MLLNASVNRLLMTILRLMCRQLSGLPPDRPNVPDTLTPFASFARRLRNDLAAVVTGLALALQVRGSRRHKIKIFRRQMSGRANPSTSCADRSFLA
jgi:hypothetical protein